MNTSQVQNTTVVYLFGAPSMIEKNPDSRQVMIQITNPAEIASIEENGFHSILGYQTPDGTWWAYKWSVEQYRERQRASFTDEGKQ